MVRGCPCTTASQDGFTYLALLFMVAVTGLLAVTMGELWSSQDRRAREAELDFVGAQYRQAIRSYYLSTPGTVKRYPATLEDLLEDRRQAKLVRHLRKLYAEPLTNQAWGLVRAADGGIRGVYSKASMSIAEETLVADRRKTRSRRFEFVALP